MTSEFKVMTAQEVADALRVSRATVTRLAQRGELVRIPVAGRLLFTQFELARFLTPLREPEQRR